MKKVYTHDSDWSSLREKIEASLDTESDPNGCWIWTRGKLKTGYGIVRWGGKNVLVHRALLMELGFDFPPNSVVDHLCRVTSCANPDHLEIVTQRENILRGIGPSAINAAKTHCVHGHEFTPENTLVVTSRVCRECSSRHCATWYRKQSDTP